MPDNLEQLVYYLELGSKGIPVPTHIIAKPIIEQ